jgi:catechol 2,3-dioxygenase-like lactoylglutathione lyase family enzyme
MIKSVSIVSIPVRDQSKSLEFYTKKLGLQILTDQPFGAQRWIELCVPGAETKLALFTPPGQEGRIGTFFEHWLFHRRYGEDLSDAGSTRRRV